MPLPNSGTISINMIRQELNLPVESNFSLNTAEDGLYVKINPCSTFKPAVPNPAELDEWWGYNHTQPCVSYEYKSVSCDTNVGICDVPFNTNQANSNIVMVAANGMSPNGDGINDTWIISNTAKFPNARFMVMKFINPTLSDIIYDFTGVYVPWNGIMNVGAYNGIKVPSSDIPYFFKIDYNDGSGRVIGGNSLTSNNSLFINYPSAGDIDTGNFSFSATSSALACASTTFESFSFRVPITTAGGLFPPNQTSGDYITNRAGYYRLQGTTGYWFRLNNSGEVMLDEFGNRIQGNC
jgi:gliding motility-associated-like protein